MNAVLPLVPARPRWRDYARAFEGKARATHEKYSQPERATQSAWHASGEVIVASSLLCGLLLECFLIKIGLSGTITLGVDAKGRVNTIYCLMVVLRGPPDVVEKWIAILKGQYSNDNAI